MKMVVNKLLILLISCTLMSCYQMDTSNSYSGINNPTSTTAVTFTENIHSSLPTTWVTEYKKIKEILLTLLPLYQTYYTSIVIYTWNDNVDDPYPGVNGGAYISNENNDDNVKRFVMEIPNDEFTYNSYHRYSVIAHEYFHTYQQTLNQHMNKPNDHESSFNTKWLIEGPAAAVEGMYIQQHYNYNYIKNDQNQLNASVIQTPELFEDYNSSETNYGSSLFMVLVLAKELQKTGATEAEAFKLIFKTYMAEQPNKLTWKTAFSKTFNMTVDEYYTKLKSYSLSTEAVLPNTSLTLDDIFK